MAWWVAAQVGLAAVSMIRSEKASKQAHAAAQKQAALYDEQAERILEAADEQIRNVRIQGEQLDGRQAVAYATSGVDITSGSAMAVMGDTARQINSEITSISREAEFQADMVRKGGQTIRDRAHDLRRAQRFNNYFGMASNVTSAMTDYAKYTKTVEALEKPESVKVEESKKAQGIILRDKKKELAALEKAFSDLDRDAESGKITRKERTRRHRSMTGMWWRREQLRRELGITKPIKASFIKQKDGSTLLKFD